jgi:hypothetical protein
VYDKVWFTFDIYVASIAECNVAILCACAPSLKAVFGRYYRDISQKYGSSRGGSKDTSPSSSQNSSKLERTIGSIKKKLTSDGDMKDQSSFKEAHEYGLETMSPLASGYGDGLVHQDEAGLKSPMKEAYKRADEEKVFGLAFQKRLPPGQVVQGPGSFIISPSPSDSSDDETSLIDKKERQDGGLPYGLPTKDDNPSWGVNARPKTSPEVVPSGTGSITSPYSVSFASAHQMASSQPQLSGIGSPVSEATLPPHAITTTGLVRTPSIIDRQQRSPLDPRISHSPAPTAGPSSPFSSDRGPPFGPTHRVEIVANDASQPPRLRKQLSKERWRQVYEKQSRHPAI